MKIGVPKEIKPDEYRVAITPSGVKTLTGLGHDVLVQCGAGAGAFFPDSEYAAAGATLVEEAGELWAASDLVYKVKEPIAPEYGFLREDLSLFTYLHMAADHALTEVMLSSGVNSIAYESVTEHGTLPLLAPMSEIAGRLAAQVGAEALLRHNGGRGVLLGGIPGTRKAKTVVIGGGVVGTQAAQLALGLGSQVTVMDISLPRLRELDAQYGGHMETLVSTPGNIEHAIADADLVIGAVLVPSARAPKVVSTEMIMNMQEGAVLVDVAVDQGGCFEPTHPTTHHDPTFKVGPALLYCVANMPGAVPRTGTIGLSNATLPYTIEIAQFGLLEAARRDERLATGLCTAGGRLTLQGVAQAWNLEYTAAQDVLGTLG